MQTPSEFVDFVAGLDLDQETNPPKRLVELVQEAREIQAGATDPRKTPSRRRSAPQ